MMVPPKGDIALLISASVSSLPASHHTEHRGIPARPPGSLDQPRYGRILVTTFRYGITDLAYYASDLIEVTLESDEEAVTVGKSIAGEMLEKRPDLARKGWTVTIYDSQRRLVSIVPIDPVN